MMTLQLCIVIIIVIVSIRHAAVTSQLRGRAGVGVKRTVQIIKITIVIHSIIIIMMTMSIMIGLDGSGPTVNTAAASAGCVRSNAIFEISEPR